VHHLRRLDWQTIVARRTSGTLRKDIAALQRNLSPARQDWHPLSNRNRQFPTSAGGSPASQAGQPTPAAGEQPVNPLASVWHARRRHGRCHATGSPGSGNHLTSPISFYKRGGNQGARQADKESIIITHQALALVQPSLEDCWRRPRPGKQGYTETVNQVTSLQQAISSLDATLKTMPPTLDISAHKSQFEQLEVIASNLEATLSRLKPKAYPCHC